MSSNIRWAASGGCDGTRANPRRVTQGPSAEPPAIRPHVLFLWSVDGIGGTETRLIEMAASLSQAGYRVHHLLSSPGAQRLRGHLEAHSRDPVASALSTAHLVRSIWAVRPDLIIAPSMRSSLLTRAYCSLRRGGVRNVMPRSGLDFGRGWPYYLADLLTSSAVNKYIVNSQEVGRHLEAHGIPASKVSWLPSALPRRWWDEPRTGHRPPVVAMIGNSRPEKNHTFGVRVFRESGIAGTLRVFTNNPREVRAEWEALEDVQDQTLEIFQNVEVLPSDYDGIRVILHPSISESLPRTLLEAGARGCRMVTADVGAVRSVTITGPCLKGYDLQEWAAALRTQFSRPSAPSAVQTVPYDTEAYAREFLQTAGLPVAPALSQKS